jgi:hypothetical protein
VVVVPLDRHLHEADDSGPKIDSGQPTPRTHWTGVGQQIERRRTERSLRVGRYPLVSISTEEIDPTK